MPLDASVAGNNLRLVVTVGDPSLPSNELNVGQTHSADGQNLGGSLFSLLVGAVPMLLNASGTSDRQRSAPGTTGIAAVNTEGVKASYGVASLGVSLAATATDFWQLFAGSKKARLLRLSITGIATAASEVDILLVKRTAANTGGTSSQPAIVAYDANDAAAVSVVNLYSANPSALGAGNPIRVAKLWLGTASSPGTMLTWDFSNRNAKAPLLVPGTNQSLCLNFNGAAVPAGTLLNIDAEFTEE